MSPSKLAQTAALPHIIPVRGMRKLLMIAGLMAGSHAGLAQQSVQLNAVPFAQPNGLVNLTLNGRWQTGPQTGTLNTQFMAYPVTSLNVGGYSHQLHTFNNQNVPFLGRAPFVSGLFRYHSQRQSLSSSRLNVTLTPVNPAGTPTHRKTQGIRAPLMYGFIAPTPLAQP